jgi:hypothetical protein
LHADAQSHVVDCPLPCERGVLVHRPIPKAARGHRQPCDGSVAFAMPLRRLLDLLALLLGGCAPWLPQGQVKQTASVMDVLFGAKADKTVMQP